MAKKIQEKCANCGDPTNFGNAKGDRLSKKWCKDCYDYWFKHHRISQYTGKEYWFDSRSIGDRANAFTSRPPKE